MLSLEERLEIKMKEEKEIEEIKERVLRDVRKEKSIFEYLQFIWCKIETEIGFSLGTNTEKMIYIPITTMILFYTIFRTLSLIFNFFIN